MAKSSEELWHRFRKYYQEFPSLGCAIDISRMDFPDDFMARIQTPMQKAFVAMAELEKGGIANPDEKRMVGHYWLRNPALAPTATIATEIRTNLANIKQFAADVHSGSVKGSQDRFENVLVIGIGGSALGPQLIADALGQPITDPVRLFFLDNTDPDGFDRVLAQLEGSLGRTLTLVVSKSGGTKETRNGMLETEVAYTAAGLKFADHAVAITGLQSELDRKATHDKWLRRFPMWDWVGGRTSVMSAVGLLPAALQGLDIEQLLAGAKACDDITRGTDTLRNPSALLALMWHHAGGGAGQRDMVVLPYKDRLLLFSRYLQQLVMESIGKEKDVNDRVTHQGLAVYGNKGSTDQHAYVQQLRDGINNFFAIFVEVLQDREGLPFFVEPGITSGDYLSGFLLGTRQALSENGRESITLTIEKVDAFRVGVLIALFERAVGFYASLVEINAYHQPGVEAGKKAATQVLELQRRIIAYLETKAGHKLTSDQVASGIGAHGEYETVFKICEHLAANGSHGIEKTRGATPFEASYGRG